MGTWSGWGDDKIMRDKIIGPEMWQKNELAGIWVPVWSALDVDGGGGRVSPALRIRVGFVGARFVVVARHHDAPCTAHGHTDQGSVPVARIGGGVEPNEAADKGEQPRRREQSGTPIGTAGFTFAKIPPCGLRL